MKHITTTLLAAVSTMTILTAETVNPAPPAATVIQAVLELTDGSRIIGVPTEKSLPITLPFAQSAVPLEVISTCEIRHKEERATLNLQNGDRMTGILGTDVFPMETILGMLRPKFAQISRISFSVSKPGALPAGEGEVCFGGVNWLRWKTACEITGDKLMTLPKARQGFIYGHGGHGRGAQIMTNIGSADWINYRMEVDYCMTGVDPAFNPHCLPADYRGGSILFHVATAKESWNEAPGTSAYGLGLNGDGSWTLECGYNSYCKTEMGWCNTPGSGSRTLASGKGLQLNPKDGNRIRIDVAGTHLMVFIDGVKIADVQDEKMRECVDGATLDHGGVGFAWGFECMGWIRNLAVTRL